jgi:hypothetical protein
MRKALLPLWASLLIGGTCTAALVVGAQAASKPATVMLAQADAAPATAPQPEAAPRMDRAAMRGRFCQNLVARKAGKIAFLETKLQLTAAQAPLFAQWKQVSLDMARQHEGDCTARSAQPRAHRGDAVERLNRQEMRLKRRLADIEAERPALTALYAALTPAQQQDFSRGEHRRMGGRMHRMMGMMGGHHGREMGRRFGRGPAGEPPLLPPSQPAQ